MLTLFPMVEATDAEALANEVEETTEALDLDFVTVADYCAWALRDAVRLAELTGSDQKEAISNAMAEMTQSLANAEASAVMRIV